MINEGKRFLSYKTLVKEAIKEMVAEKYMGFKKLKKSLAGKKGVTNPGALAASIGRKKYGKAKFQKAAAAGKKITHE